MSRGMLLGFVFFVALVLLGFATLIVGDLSHYLLKSEFHLKIHFNDVLGLRKGDDVRVDGVQFGTVDSITLDQPSGVLVRVRLDEPIELSQDHEIFVESSSVLGGFVISIKRGSTPPKLDVFHNTLTGTTRPGLEEFGEMAAENRINFRQMIDNLKDVTQALKDGRGTVGQAIQSPKLHEEALAALEAARATIDEIRKTAESARSVIGKIEGGEGPLARLISDKQMSEKLVKAVDNIERSSGSIEKAGEDIRKMVERVEAGEGTLGRLIGDKEMGDKLKQTVDNIEKSSASIRNITGKLEVGEGSIGRLLKDEELYDKAKKTLDDMDKVFAKAAGTLVEIAGESRYYKKSEMQISKIGLRITPGEDKYFYAGAAFLGLNKKGDILFKDIVDDRNDTVIKPEILLAYRIPWFLDRRLTVRGGLIEGKPGGGVDFVWDDWGPFKHPVQFTFEGRDAYNSLDRENIDEELGGPLLRAYVKAPVWTGRDTWYELLLSTLRVFGGYNRLDEDPEFLVGIGAEWPDDDIRTLVSLIGLAR